MTSTPSGPDEGDYPDRDLPEGDVEAGEGSYTDQETPAEKRGEEPDVRGPHDHGQYTDSDDAEQHRPAHARRGYTSTDTGHGTGHGTGHDTSTREPGEEHPHG